MTEHTSNWRPRGSPYEFFNGLEAKHLLTGCNTSNRVQSAAIYPARDKVTRMQHLGALAMVGQPPNQPKYEVIACIAGRGFGVRREDMKKLLLATHRRVFTSQNLDRLIEFTRLRKFQTKKV
jgi:hypothetical protein